MGIGTAVLVIANIAACIAGVGAIAAELCNIAVDGVCGRQLMMLLLRCAMLLL